MKSSHIAIVIDDFYPSSGGIGRSVQAQINELAGLGHEVTLIAPRHLLKAPENCRVIALPLFYLPGMPIYTGVLSRKQRIIKHINNGHKFDIVHSQTERGALSLAAHISRGQRIPHVHTFHANLSGTHATLPILAFFGTLAYKIAIIPPFARISHRRTTSRVHLPPNQPDVKSILERLDWHSFATIASRVDAFSAPADFMIKEITKCSAELKDRGKVVPTGVSALFSEAIANSKRTVSDNKIRFLSVCRLSKEKRVKAIIQAFIATSLPNSQLDIVGTGDQLRKLQKIASGFDNIIFHEQVDNLDKLASLYLNADIFIIASYKFDTQGITIGEAAVAGLPIIYCDDRLSFGLDPKNSILADSPEPKDIAKAMKEMSNSELRRQLSSRSKQIAPSLSPEKMANQYVSLYESAILSYKDS